MSRINQNQIKKEISHYLSNAESLVSIWAFKRVPSTAWLFISKGMAWFLSPDFYVGVTDQRLIILPNGKFKNQSGLVEDVIFANFDEVRLYNGAFNNTILDIQKIYRGQPLKLRFKPGYQFMGMDQFDFIATVKQGKNAYC